MFLVMIWKCYGMEEVMVIMHNINNYPILKTPSALENNEWIQAVSLLVF